MQTGRVLVGWLMAGMERWHPSAEYTEEDMSPFFWTNGTPPKVTI